MALIWKPCIEPIGAWAAEASNGKGQYTVEIRGINPHENKQTGETEYEIEYGWDYAERVGPDRLHITSGDDYSDSLVEAVRRAEWHDSGQDLDNYHDVREVHES